MKLIVGLGNPGDKYQHNRHNAGFIVIDKLVKDAGFEWKEKNSFQALISEHGDGDDKFIYLKPQTFMNLSGQAIQKAMHFYKLDSSDVTVIHDELDIPFGDNRSKTGGGSAGHNGIESVTANIGEDYNRIRIGIRSELTELVEADKFVLSNFSKEEYKSLLSSVHDIRDLL